MDTQEPVIISSPLCQTIERDGHTLKVEIYREESKQWVIEAIDMHGTSHVFEDTFETDKQALETLLSEIEEQGIEQFIN